MPPRQRKAKKKKPPKEAFRRTNRLWRPRKDQLAGDASPFLSSAREADRMIRGLGKWALGASAKPALQHKVAWDCPAVPADDVARMGRGPFGELEAFETQAEQKQRERCGRAALQEHAVERLLKEHRHDEALATLISARRKYAKGGDAANAARLRELEHRVRGERALVQIQPARSARDYDRCLEFLREACAHLPKDAPPSARPLQSVLLMAVNDGNDAKRRAHSALQLAQFDTAEACLADADTCYGYANLPARASGVAELRDDAAHLGTVHGADALVLEACLALQPVVDKDYDRVDATLDRAEATYLDAGDASGVELAGDVRAAAEGLRAADEDWRRAARYVAQYEYDAALEQLVLAGGAYEDAVPVSQRGVDALCDVLRAPEAALCWMAMDDAAALRAQSAKALEDDFDALAARGFLRAAQLACDWAEAHAPAARRAFDVDDSRDALARRGELRLARRQALEAYAAGGDALMARLLAAELRADDPLPHRFKAERAAAVRLEHRVDVAEAEARGQSPSEVKRLARERELASAEQSKERVARLATAVNPLVQRRRYGDALEMLRAERADGASRGDPRLAAAIDRLEHCVRGDRALSSVPEQLRLHNYDAALELLQRADRHYAETDDAARQGETRGARERVAAAARSDAAKCREQALGALSKGNTGRAADLHRQAGVSAAWAGGGSESGDGGHLEHLEHEIRLIEAHKAGDRVMDSVMELLSRGMAERAVAQLDRAKQHFQAAQTHYQWIMDRVAALFAADRAPEALALKEELAQFYDIREDGNRIARVEIVRDCLGADLSFARLEPLLANGAYDGALGLLNEAQLTYERASDAVRLKKVLKLREFVVSYGAFTELLNEFQYDRAVDKFDETRQLHVVASSYQPRSIVVPPHAIFSREKRQLASREIVGELAVEAAQRAREGAVIALKGKDFSRAKRLATNAAVSYRWAHASVDAQLVKSLQQEIEKQRVLFAGEQEYAEAVTAMGSADWARALEKFRGAQEHFSECGAAGNVAKASQHQALCRGELTMHKVAAVIETENFRRALGLLAEAAAEFGRAGAESRAADVRRMQGQVQGDMVHALVASALQGRNYDKALALLHEAHTAYVQAEDKVRQLEVAQPEKLVREQAIRDGDRIKGEAAVALKKKDIVGARRLCASAQVCYSWAKMHAVHSGIHQLQQEIDIVENHELGNDKMAAANEDLDAHDYQAAYSKLADARRFFRGAQQQALADEAESMRATVGSDLTLTEIVPLLKKRRVDTALEVCARAQNTYRAANKVADVGRWKSSLGTRLEKIAEIVSVLKALQPCGLGPDGRPHATGATYGQALIEATRLYESTARRGKRCAALVLPPAPSIMQHFHLEHRRQSNAAMHAALAAAAAAGATPATVSVERHRRQSNAAIHAAAMAAAAESVRS